MSTCAVYKDHIYGVSERGSLFCASVKTGKSVWNENVAGKFGTLIIVNDIIVALSDKGNLITAKADASGYKPIASHQMLQGTCWVSPTYSNGYLFIKNNKGDTIAIKTK